MHSTLNAFYIQEHSGTLFKSSKKHGRAQQRVKHNQNTHTVKTPQLNQFMSIRLLKKVPQYSNSGYCTTYQHQNKNFDSGQKGINDNGIQAHSIEGNIPAATGFSINSNSESTLSSYASIFEVLYNQSILFEQLRQDDNIKSEFINVAAHEIS